MIIMIMKLSITMVITTIITSIISYYLGKLLASIYEIIGLVIVIGSFPP